MKIAFYSRYTKLFKVLNLLLLFFIIVCVFRLAGWKFFGFIFCEQPDELICNSVYVTDTSLAICGYSRKIGEPDPSIAFLGYKYEIINDTMYIGLKADYFSGLKPNFEIIISDNEISKIDNIYFTNGNHKKDVLVWNRLNNGLYFERFENIIFLQDATDITFLWDNSKIMCEGNPADQKFTDMIRKPFGLEVKPATTQWTIDDYYLCAAETSSGIFEFLKIKNDNSCFIEYGRPQIVYYLGCQGDDSAVLAD